MKKRKGFMKTFFSTIALIFCLGIANNVSAQFFVRIRPIAPVIIAPPIPSPRHIWIPGEWRWNKRRGEYVWREGHWLVPKPGREWIPGFWEDGRDGSRWIPGHWRRARR